MLKEALRLLSVAVGGQPNDPPESYTMMARIADRL